MLKRKPANEYHRMLPKYIGEYEPRQKNIDFEPAKEGLLEADKELGAKR